MHELKTDLPLTPSPPHPFNKKSVSSDALFISIFQIKYFLSRTPPAAHRLTKRLIPEGALEGGFIITFIVNPFTTAPWRRWFRMRLHHQRYRPVQSHFNNLRFNILSFKLHPWIMNFNFNEIVPKTIQK